MRTRKSDDRALTALSSKQVHKDAFVDLFEGDNYWNYLYENDPEGQNILTIEETKDTQAV